MIKTIKNVYNTQNVCSDYGHMMYNSFTIQPRKCNIMALQGCSNNTLYYFHLLIDCACFALYGHAGLCYITWEAQPIMADP